MSQGKSRGELAVGPHRGHRRRHAGRSQFNVEQRNDHEFLPASALPAMIDVGFSYEDPPYKVRQALLDLILQTDGVLSTPKPTVSTVGYGEFSVKISPDRLHVGKRPMDGEERVDHTHLVHGETSRVHVALSVHVALQHRAGASLQSGGTRPRTCWASSDVCRRFSPEDRSATRAMTFGAGERLFDTGDDLDGVYFVVSGTVSLQIVKDGEVSEIATIQAGEFCGETGMLGHQAADKRAVALEDTVVALIAPDVVRHLFEASPRLARETGHLSKST